MPYIIENHSIVNVNHETEYQKMNYPKNDLMSVFVHWDDELKRNVTTENKLPNKNLIPKEDNSNG